MEQVYSPTYQKLFEADQVERQTLIAKNAMAWAHKKLEEHKNQNNHRLPLTELLKLKPEIENPSRETRHVTIAISGFLTQAEDKTL